MLKIDTVILDNFCQHAHRELSFPAGITGIFGRNGNGKTNIANAIYSAFTGSFTRHAEGAAGCIRQGCDSAYIEVHGELSGQKFRLRRDLFPARIKHTLWINEEKYSDKARDIELWITEASGLTPQMMTEFVFIGQQDLYAFLEANDSERSKKFTALCNTRIYEQLRDEYGEMLKLDRARSEAASDVSIDLMKQTIASLERNLKDLRNVAKEIGKDINSQPVPKMQLLTIGEQLKKDFNILDQYDTAVTRTEQCKQALQKQTEQVEQCRQASEKATRLVEQLRNQLRDCLQGQDYDEYLNDLKEQQAIEQNREQLCRQLASLNEKRGDRQELREWTDTRLNACADEVTKIKTEISDIEYRIQSRQVLIDSLEESETASPICPSCGSEWKHWAVDPALLTHDQRQDISKKSWLKHDLTDADRRYETELGRKRNYETLRTQLNVLAQQIGELEEQLSDMPEQVKPLPDIEAEIRELTHITADGKLGKVKAQNAEERLKREQTLLAQTEQDVKDAEAFLADLVADSMIEITAEQDRDGMRERLQAKINTNKEQIRIIDNLLREQSENNGSIREAERQLEEAKRKLAEQEERAANSGKIKQWFASCDRAVAWLKKEGLPRLVHRSILRQLTSLINTELSQYDNSFAIEVNDDLTFTAIFADGRRINSRALSGGQKTMLALSFLSAINRTFLQDIGIMVWDEPTDGLDPVNTETLYSILEQKKKLLHQRGQQLVIITFDEGMIPVFDAVCRIGQPQTTPQTED